MKGVCAFDIDETLTCKLSSCATDKIKYMVKSINMCLNNNMGVVVNTARPPQNQMLWGIHDDVQEALLRNNDSFKIYSRPYTETTPVPEYKLLNTLYIANDFKVDKTKVVLVDNRKDICDIMSEYNIPNVHVSSENGIGKDEYEKLRDVLKYM
jgi:hypothetical protein